MTENAETFLATLLNLNRITVDNEDSNNKEIDLENLMLDSDDESDGDSIEAPSCKTITKNIRAYSIYQMILYTVNEGKTKTPLHVMTGHSIYTRCRSRSTITTLNKIGVSISYDEVRRGQALLASYAI